jgi:hypothetical protein
MPNIHVRFNTFLPGLVAGTRIDGCLVTAGGIAGAAAAGDTCPLAHPDMGNKLVSDNIAGKMLKLVCFFIT